MLAGSAVKALTATLKSALPRAAVRDHDESSMTFDVARALEVLDGVLGKGETRRACKSDLALVAAARCVDLAQACEPGRKLPIARLVEYQLGDTLVLDDATQRHLELVRTMAPRFDAIVAGVFVRAASASGRLDLTPPLAVLLTQIGAATKERSQPFVAVLFGNPYTAMTLRDLPAVLVTYDFYDRAERSAVRALAGEAPIGGRLPIALPELFPVGHGLDRAAAAPER